MKNMLRIVFTIFGDKKDYNIDSGILLKPKTFIFDTELVVRQSTKSINSSK